MKRHDILWGLLFILAAALILLNQFGMFIDISMFDLIATVVLGVIIIKSLFYLNFWGVFFPLAFLCILYSDELGITNFTLWPALFTALLLSIGFSILFQRNYGWGGRWNHRYHHHHHNSFSSNVVNEKDEGAVSCSASFGECIKYINSENFERADISCSFGSMKVYFDNAKIPSGKAEIYIDVSFGEVVLYIPRSWKTECKAKIFCGDMNQNGNIGPDSPVVTIHGNVSFGNAKIIYV